MNLINYLNFIKYQKIIIDTDIKIDKRKLVFIKKESDKFICFQSSTRIGILSDISDNIAIKIILNSNSIKLIEKKSGDFEIDISIRGKNDIIAKVLNKKYLKVGQIINIKYIKGFIKLYKNNFLIGEFLFNPIKHSIQLLNKKQVLITSVNKKINVYIFLRI